MPIKYVTPNGKAYDIPEDKVQDFLKDNPGSEEAQTFRSGGKKFNIPKSKVDAFLNDNPDATDADGNPVKKKAAVGPLAPAGGNGSVSGQPTGSTDFGLSQYRDSRKVEAPVGPVPRASGPYDVVGTNSTGSVIGGGDASQPEPTDFGRGAYLDQKKSAAEPGFAKALLGTGAMTDFADDAQLGGYLQSIDANPKEKAVFLDDAIAKVQGKLDRVSEQARALDNVTGGDTASGSKLRKQYGAESVKLQGVLNDLRYKRDRTNVAPAAVASIAGQQDFSEDALHEMMLNDGADYVKYNNPEKYKHVQSGKLGEFEQYDLYGQGYANNRQLLDEQLAEASKRYDAADDGSLDQQHARDDVNRIADQMAMLDKAYRSVSDKLPLVKAKLKEQANVDADFAASPNNPFNALQYGVERPVFNALGSAVRGSTNFFANGLAATGLVDKDALLAAQNDMEQDFMNYTTPTQTKQLFDDKGRVNVYGVLPTIANTTTQSALFYFGGEALTFAKMEELGQFASVLVQTQDQYEKQYLDRGLSKADAYGMSIVMGMTEAATERIIPEEKIWGSMAGVRKDVMGPTAELYAQMKRLKGDPLTAVTDFTKGYVKLIAPEIAEEEISNVAQYVYDTTYNYTNGDKRDMQVDPLTWRQAYETAVSTAIGMVPTSVRGGLNNVSTGRMAARFAAGENPNDALEMVNRMRDNGRMTDLQHKTATSTIEAMRDVVARTPHVGEDGAPLDEETRMRWAAAEYNRVKAFNDLAQKRKAGAVTEETVEETKTAVNDALQEQASLGANAVEFLNPKTTVTPPAEKKADGTAKEQEPLHSGSVTLVHKGMDYRVDFVDNKAVSVTHLDGSEVNNQTGLKEIVKQKAFEKLKSDETETTPTTKTGTQAQVRQEPLSPVLTNAEYQALDPQQREDHDALVAVGDDEGLQAFAESVKKKLNLPDDAADATRTTVAQGTEPAAPTAAADQTNGAPADGANTPVVDNNQAGIESGVQPDGGEQPEVVSGNVGVENQPLTDEQPTQQQPDQPVEGQGTGTDAGAPVVNQDGGVPEPAPGTQSQLDFAGSGQPAGTTGAGAAGEGGVVSGNDGGDSAAATDQTTAGAVPGADEGLRNEAGTTGGPSNDGQVDAGQNRPGRKITSKNALKKALREDFGITSSLQREAIAEVAGAAVKGLSRILGISEADYWKHYFPNVVSGSKPGDGALDQKQGKKVRGAADVVNRLVYALTDPNVSTPLHELSHVWFQDLQNAADLGNKVAKKLLADFDAFAQSTAGKEFWARTYKDKAFDAGDAGYRHELFARSFEKYLQDGKAPHKTLQGFFEMFKDWLTTLYKGVANSPVKIELNEPMRRVYDQMLGFKRTSRQVTTKQAQSRADGARAEMTRLLTTATAQDVSDKLKALQAGYNKSLKWFDAYEKGEATADDATYELKFKALEQAGYHIEQLKERLDALKLQALTEKAKNKPRDLRAEEEAGRRAKERSLEQQRGALSKKKTAAAEDDFADLDYDPTLDPDLHYQEDLLDAFDEADAQRERREADDAFVTGTLQRLLTKAAKTFSDANNGTPPSAEQYNAMLNAALDKVKNLPHAQRLGGAYIDELRKAYGKVPGYTAAKQQNRAAAAGAGKRMHGVLDSIIHGSAARTGAKLSDADVARYTNDPDSYYKQLPDEEAKLAAADFVREMGSEQAFALADSASSEMPLYLRALVLGHFMTEAGRAGDTEKEVNLDEAALKALMQLGTDIGRGLRAYQAIYAMSGLGMVLKAERRVRVINHARMPVAKQTANEVTAVYNDPANVEQTVADLQAASNQTLAEQKAALEARIADLEKKLAESKSRPRERTGTKPAGERGDKAPKFKRSTNKEEFLKALQWFGKRLPTGLNTDDLRNLSYVARYGLENLIESGIASYERFSGWMKHNLNKHRDQWDPTYREQRNRLIEDGADPALFDDDETLDRIDAADREAAYVLELSKMSFQRYQLELEEHPDAADKMREMAAGKAAQRILLDATEDGAPGKAHVYLKELVKAVVQKARDHYQQTPSGKRGLTADQYLTLVIQNSDENATLWQTAQAEVSNALEQDDKLTDDEKDATRQFLEQYFDNIAQTLLATKRGKRTLDEKLIQLGYGATDDQGHARVDWKRLIGTPGTASAAADDLRRSLDALGLDPAATQAVHDELQGMFRKGLVDAATAPGALRDVLVRNGHSDTVQRKGKAIEQIDWKGLTRDKQKAADALGQIKANVDRLPLTDAEKAEAYDELAGQFNERLADTNTNAVNAYLRKSKGVVTHRGSRTAVGRMTSLWRNGLLDSDAVLEALWENLGLQRLTVTERTQLRQSTERRNATDVPVFKRKHEEEIQYVFDKKNAGHRYASMMEFLTSNQLGTVGNFTQNGLTGKIYQQYVKAMNALLLRDPAAAKALNAHAMTAANADKNTVFYGELGHGSAFVDLSDTQDGEVRVRRAEHGPINPLAALNRQWGWRPLTALATFTTKYGRRGFEAYDSETASFTNHSVQYRLFYREYRKLYPQDSKAGTRARVAQTMWGPGYAAMLDLAKKEVEADRKPSLLQPGTKPYNALVSRVAYELMALERLKGDGGLLTADRAKQLMRVAEQLAQIETYKTPFFGFVNTLPVLTSRGLQKLARSAAPSDPGKEPNAVGNTVYRTVNFVHKVAMPFTAGIANWVEQSTEFSAYGLIKGAVYKGLLGATNKSFMLGERRVETPELSQDKRDLYALAADNAFQKGVAGMVLQGAAYAVLSLMAKALCDDDMSVRGSGVQENFARDRVGEAVQGRNTLRICGHVIPLWTFGPFAPAVTIQATALDYYKNQHNAFAKSVTLKDGTVLREPGLTEQIGWGARAALLAMFTASTDIALSRGQRFLGATAKTLDGEWGGVATYLGTAVGSAMVPLNNVGREAVSLFTEAKARSDNFWVNVMNRVSVAKAIPAGEAYFDYRGRHYTEGELYPDGIGGLLEFFKGLTYKDDKSDDIDRFLMDLNFTASDYYMDKTAMKDNKYVVMRDGKPDFLDEDEAYWTNRLAAERFDALLKTNYPSMQKDIGNLQRGVSETTTDDGATVRVTGMPPLNEDQAKAVVLGSVGKLKEQARQDGYDAMLRKLGRRGIPVQDVEKIMAEAAESVKNVRVEIER